MQAPIDAVYHADSVDVDLLSGVYAQLMCRDRDIEAVPLEGALAGARDSVFGVSVCDGSLKKLVVQVDMNVE